RQGERDGLDRRSVSRGDARDIWRHSDRTASRSNRGPRATGLDWRRDRDRKAHDLPQRHAHTGVIMPMRVSIAIAVLLTSGCSKLLSYPDADNESSEAACKDGVDNDLNGKIDCSDPSCDGRCPEETLVACSDRRDNDGDRLIDFEDPRCWRFANLSIARCASVQATTFVSHFDSQSIGTEWFTSNGDPFEIVTSTAVPGFAVHVGG